MRNKILIAVSIALVAIASGCVDGPEDDDIDVNLVQTSGVDIVDFRIVPEEIPDTRNPDLILELENRGEFDAENVEAEIFNVGFGSTEDRQWEGQQEMSFGTLQGVDPDQAQDGRNMERMVGLEAPNLEPDEPAVPYEFGISVSYDYRTTSTTELEFVGQDRFYDEDMERTDPEMDNTAAPVQMDVRTQTPFVFEQDTRVQVEVENVGTGEPRYDGEDEAILLDVRQPGDLDLEPRNAEDLPMNVELGRDGDQTVLFDVDPDFEVTGDVQRTSPITFTADYTYEQEQFTTVEVEGMS